MLIISFIVIGFSIVIKNKLKIKKAGSKRAATESLLDEYSDVMEAKKKGIKTKKQFKQMKKEKAKKTAKEFKGLPK